MKYSNLLNGLNEKQREAVIESRSNLLVLAGAGSGKTRVLVHRIAWLLATNNCTPYSIMAVTFTNKAAEEMRNRIYNLIGNDEAGMWIGTFHGLAHRILRIHYFDIGLPHDFQIIDNEDQLRLLKRLIKTMNIDEKEWSPRKSLWYINSKKDAGLRPHHIESYDNVAEQTWLRIYKSYQETCDRAGLVDFAELLLRAHELWLNNPQVLNHYRKRFSNILVDEFQDINNIQYAWIRILVGNTGRIFIVGDDDQSIYGWRGAQVQNIYRFLQDFPNSKIIRLEQNYRSTNNILKAANALITNNKVRFGKELWTDKKDGEPIFIYCALNELDEAHFVVNQIKKFYKKGYALVDCAILYRSNAQSRILEEALLKENLPYCIYGGMRFFERQEIKDILAYLRLIINRNDDAAFERIINIPARGIGEQTLSKIQYIAKEQTLTLWQSAHKLLKSKILKGRVACAIQHFLNLIDSLSIQIAKLPLYLQADTVIKNSGLWLMYERQSNEKNYSRIENLKEFVTASRQFSSHYRDKEKELTPLQEFISNIAIESGNTQIKKNQDAVKLMTLHSAKGLEFSIVFIVGLEEGLFPSQMSLNEDISLEEERRLAYVGVTRAIQKLTLTYATSRRIYGKEVYYNPSRFINELPKKCLQHSHVFTNSNDKIKYSHIVSNYRYKKKT